MSEQDSSTNKMLAIEDADSAPRVSRSKMSTIAIAILVITNIATLSMAIAFAFTSPFQPAPPPQSSQTDLSKAVFTAQHVTSEKDQKVLVEELSTKNMKRHVIKGDTSDPITKNVVAAGANILVDDSGTSIYEIHLQVVNGSTFGEFTNGAGVVGSRTLQLTFLDVETGHEAVVVPMSLSFAHGATLVPNLYFFSYRSKPGAVTKCTFVSTVAGTYTLQDETLRKYWDALMVPALDAYAKAWMEDHPPEEVSRRRLSFDSWAGGKVGGYLGGSMGAAAGSMAGSIADGADPSSTVGWGVAGYAASQLGGSTASNALHAVHDIANGDNVGEAVGDVAGGAIGASVGASVGGAVVGAAGGALGAAVGGPLGACVGEEAGSWLGSEAGKMIGSSVGSDLGSDIGGDVESMAEDAWNQS